MQLDKNSELNRLRKPTTQILNILTLVFILFSCITYSYELTLSTTPSHLIVTTILEFIIILIGLIQLLERKKNDNGSRLKNKAKRYLTVGVLSAYLTLLSFYNIYFFMGIEQGFNLTSYWFVGFVTFLICSCAHIFSLVLMISTPKWPKNKMAIIMMLKAIAILFYVQKIVEYIMIPNVSESHFIFLLMILLIFGVNLITSQLFIIYGNIIGTKVSLNKN